MTSALVALAAGTVSAETYKWVDAQGQVHYSDRPPPEGAQEVQLIPAQTFRAPAAARPAAPATKTGNTSVAYSQFDIRTPQTGEVVSNTSGKVNVQVRLEPELQPGHSILIYLDGKRVDGIPKTGSEFPLSNVSRGEHQLVAVVADTAAKSVISTDPVSFVVRQKSVAKPPQGPAQHP
jgi:hypothetical protein